MGKDYYSLANSEAALVADEEILRTLIGMGRMNLLTGIYKRLYTTPEIYEYCQRTLSIEDLKIFQELVLKNRFPASRAAITSITEQAEYLTEDDGYAILCGMIEKIDVILDDPRKTRFYSARSVHVVRLSDILSAAAVTKTANGGP